MPGNTSELSEVTTLDLKAWDGQPFLEKITGVVPSIIYIFNQQTQTSEYSNRNLAESLGYSSEEVNAMGEQFMPRLCHPDDLPAMGTYFDRLRKLSDGEVSTFEYRMKHKNGQWVWLMSHDTVFERDDNGQVLRHIGVASNITAQKEAEMRALAANNELKTFAYSISHDLKSPSNTLAMLISELQQTQQERLDDDGHELLKHTANTVARMQQRIVDVLRYSTVVESSPDMQAVALDEVMDSVLSDLSHDIELYETRVVFDDLPVVEGNKTLLTMLFQNLISNALKYSHKQEHPQISIYCMEQPDATGHRGICVRDNGIGIDESDHEKIFELFHRVHAGDEYSGGSGIGLATCKRIAQSHGARIEVASSPGRGTVFTVWFPPAVVE